MTIDGDRSSINRGQNTGPGYYVVRSGAVTPAPYDVGMADDPEPPEHSVEVAQSFLGQARALADWHRQRADNFESKAGSVLGFSGAIIVLSALVVSPIGEVHGRWQVAMIVGAVLASASFLTSGAFAIAVLWPREYQFASRSQLQTEWMRFQHSAEMTDFQIVGMLADQLICGTDKDKSPLETLVKGATTRGKALQKSIAALAVGFVLDAAVAAALLIEVSVR